MEEMRMAIRRCVRQSIGFSCAVVVSILLAPRAHAQHNSSNTSADSLLSITTDTGALAPGHKTFARYDTPGLCLAGVVNATDIARRTIDLQMLVILDSLRALGPQSGHLERVTWDTLPTAAIRVARNCGAHFSPGSVPADQTLDYLQLALFAQNDTLASSIVTRWLAQARTAEARDSVWELSIGAYLAAKPARLNAVNALLAQLDTSGRDRASTRLAGHGIMLRFAVGRFDHALIRREGERILALAERLSDDELKASRARVAWDSEALTQLLDVAYLDMPDSVLVIAERAKRTLGRPASDATTGAATYATMTPAALVERVLSFAHLQANRSGPSIQFPQAAYTYPVPGAPSDTTTRVTLRVMATTDLGSDLVNGMQYAQLYSHIKQWHEWYGSRLSIVIVCQAGGYWATGTKGTGPMAIEEESERARALFQDYLKLPVQVDVYRSTVRWQSDGRRRIEPVVPQLEQTMRESGPVVLTDAHNRLQYDGQLTPAFEALLSRMMQDDSRITSGRR